jgi:hypothetical protein
VLQLHTLQCLCYFKQKGLEFSLVSVNPLAEFLNCFSKSHESYKKKPLLLSHMEAAGSFSNASWKCMQISRRLRQGSIFWSENYIYRGDKYNFMKISVADPEPSDMDPDPVGHFDTNPDPAFQFDTDPDLTV